MKAKALPAGVLLRYLMILTLASLLPSSDHGLNCEEACCSEKEKKRNEVFSFPFLGAKEDKKNSEQAWTFLKRSESCCHVRFFATPWTIVYGILQGRILEWVACPFSSGSSQPRRWTRAPCIAGGFFTNWATREALIEIPWSLNRERCEHS